MNEAEIQRIGNEAAAEESQLQQVVNTAALPGMPDLSEEFAEFLDMGASVVSIATGLPVAQRFTHSANVQIAQQAIKLCQRYGIDARAWLVGQDSALGVWLGLGVAVAVPGLGVWADYKAKKAANDSEEEQGGASGEGSSNQQSSQ